VALHSAQTSSGIGAIILRAVASRNPNRDDWRQ